MNNRRRKSLLSFGLVVFISLSFSLAKAATLSGSFAPIAQGSNVNLTAEGPLDWVHWGLQTDSSINRKAGVAPLISDFTVLYNTNLSYAAAYRYDDNFNGCSWSDGTPTSSATNTTTGVYVVKAFSAVDTNGFEFTVPADPTVKTLKVYVGTFATRGRLQASLNEPGVPTYSNTDLVNSSNGPGGVYTIDFAADSPGKTLTVRWTVVFTPNSPLDANVTLQSAALTASGANNPPYVRLSTPIENAVFSVPATVSITANVGDADGIVTNVAYYDHETFIGNGAVNSSHEFNWNAPAGYHLLTARATDNLGATTISSPVEIFGNTDGGTLTGSVAVPPASVNLTDEGTRDWAHWGLVASNSFDHKAIVTQQVSNFTKLGTGTVERFFDYQTSFNWSDGAPTANANTATGIFITGATNGFEILAPADTTPRTLKVYVSLYGSTGNFQAYLSDFSAAAFTDTSVSNTFGNSYAVYTLNYAAASANQSLMARFKSRDSFDADFGNVALASATLSVSSLPAPVMFNVESSGNNFMFSFLTQTNANYLVQFTDSLNPIDWQPLTNFIGNGATTTLTNTIIGSEKFYRVTAQ